MINSLLVIIAVLAFLIFIFFCIRAFNQSKKYDFQTPKPPQIQEPQSGPKPSSSAKQFASVKVKKVESKDGAVDNIFRGHLNGPGTYAFDIVGESNHQFVFENLDDLTLPAFQNLDDPLIDRYEVDRTVKARLISDKNNKCDKNTIRVEIDGQTVGHLSRNYSAHFHKVLTRRCYSSIDATCSAKIVGGVQLDSGKKTHYRLKLDLSIKNPFVIDADSDFRHDSHLSEKSAGTDNPTFDFYVEKINEEILDEVRVGDVVTIWYGKNANTLFVFMAPSVGGSEKLGVVPLAYYADIADLLSLSSGFRQYARISEVKNDKIRITCQFYKEDEIHKVADDRMLKKQ